MPVPLIAAGVVAAASIGGAALSSHSTSKAANQAATAQSQTADKNNALQLDIYNRNTANFAPYSATGLRAMGTLNGLLYGQPSGGGSAQVSASSLGSPGAAASPTSALTGYPSGAPDSGSGYGTGGLHLPSQLMDGADPGADYGASYAPAGIGDNGGPPLDNATAAPVATDPNAQDAWDQFRNGSQYQWRLGQGFNALNQGLASQGALHSGAAQKAAIRYGQGFASNELGNYINLLQGQQNLGFGGAQALAGVSNTYGTNVSANNQNAADAASNAALLRGQAQNQFYGSAANALGNFASSFGKGF